MQLAELTVRGFADLLGSDAPAPGGGSAAPPSSRPLPFPPSGVSAFPFCCFLARTYTRPPARTRAIRNFPGKFLLLFRRKFSFFGPPNLHPVH
mgnify:CR=1 FL=1